ncbi:unnamed protein product, partial [Iphiclides podalirius]
MPLAIPVYMQVNKRDGMSNLLGCGECFLVDMTSSSSCQLPQRTHVIMEAASARHAQPQVSNLRLWVRVYWARLPVDKRC